MANAPGSSPGRVVRERSGFLSPLDHRTVALVWSADDMFGFPKWRGLIGQAHYIEKGLANHFHSDGWVRHKCVNRLENLFFQIVACRLFAARPLFELNVGILFTPRLKCIYTSVGVTESGIMPLYDRTTTETEMSPGWLTWLSMGALRLAFRWWLGRSSWRHIRFIDKTAMRSYLPLYNILGTSLLLCICMPIYSYHRPYNYYILPVCFECLYILPLYILCIYSFMYWKSGTSDLLVLMLFVLQCTDYKQNFLTLTLTFTLTTRVPYL